MLTELENEYLQIVDRGYTYELYPFKRVMQKSNDESIVIGTWNKWWLKDDHDQPDYSLMIYDNGDLCWNGPLRSTKVSFYFNLLFF